MKRSYPLRVEIATGVSIIGLALANVYLLNRSLSYLELSIDALLLIVYEFLARNPKTKGRWYANANLWTAIIIIATVLVVALNLF